MKRAALLFAFLVGCGGGVEQAETKEKPASPTDTGTAPSEDTAPVIEQDSTPPALEDAPVEDSAKPWSPDLVDLALPCTDVAEDIYRTPSMTSAAAGDVVRCFVDTTLNLDATKSRLTGTDIDATTGVRQLRVAFRTQRSNGNVAASSARVYLPLIPRTGPLPVIVIGHPSEGLADSCAPSRREDTMKEIALPFAARGYAVIAPDLSGLGNEGTQAYLDNRDTAYSLLDGARALRKLVKPGAFDKTVVMAGYSQGGGAVLAAQALAGTYGVDGELKAVIAFAAQYPTRMESFGFVDLLNKPDDLTIAHGYSKPVVALLRTYAWFANSGREAGGGIPSANRSSLSSAIESMCLIPLGGAMQARAPRVKDFIDDELRVGLLACMSSPTDAKCTGTAKEYYEFLTKNHVTNDPAGAKVLYVQGMLDTVMPANEEASCNTKKLRAEGVPLSVCTDSGATHANVVQRNIKSAMAWLDATLAGTTPPTCTNALAACK
jgi:pimeloyl-ACP methyl ester carboxylesterase